ncbi:MAG: hypothetical protein IPJ40_20595 [Saprospirales bacterium]|nr:hypothetical protein [Saprospirales bacterium]
MHCILSGNQARSGAGIFNDGRQGTSSPAFTNCIISGNLATRDGGGFYNFGGFAGNSSPSLTNCLLAGNKAQRIGGGLYNDAVDAVGGTSSPSLINCTLSGNHADFGTGGIFSNGSNGGVSNPVLLNCILWGNSSEIGNTNATTTVDYSLVQGGYPGTNNLSGDPLFVTPVASASAPTTAGDLRLQVGSPAIHAGNSAGVTIPPFLDDGLGNAIDLDGLLRIEGVMVDMGAYEFPCYAAAGELLNSLASETLVICQGSDPGFTFSAVGAETGAEYLYAFLLVDASGLIVESTTDGDFDLAVLTQGPYTVYGLSYANFNTPGNIADYLTGKTLQDIQNDDSGTDFCLNLTGAPAAGHTNVLTLKAVGCGTFPWAGN